MAAAMFGIIIVSLAVAVGAFILGHRIGKSVDITRKRDVRSIRLQLAKLAGQIGRIETLALNNVDGFVLSTDILKITRTESED